MDRLSNYIRFIIGNLKLLALLGATFLAFLALVLFVFTPGLSSTLQLAYVIVTTIAVGVTCWFCFVIAREISEAAFTEQNWVRPLFRFLVSLSLACLVYLFLFLFLTSGIKVVALPGEQIRLNGADFDERPPAVGSGVEVIAEAYRDYMSRIQPVTDGGIFQPQWFNDSEAMRYSLQTDIVTDLLLQTARSLPRLGQSDGFMQTTIKSWLRNRLGLAPRGMRDTQAAFTVVKLNQLYTLEETGRAINSELAVRSILTGDFNMLPGRAESIGYGMELKFLGVISLPIVDHWETPEHSLLLFPGVTYKNGRYNGIVQGDMPGVNLDLPFSQFKFKPVKTAGFVELKSGRTKAANSFVVKPFAKETTDADIPLPSTGQSVLGVVNLIEFWVTKGLSGWPLYFLFLAWFMTTGALFVLRIQTYILATDGGSDAGSTPPTG